MPHLQIELNKPLTDEVKEKLTRRVKTIFADIMDTGTDHIATTLREHGTYNLDLGRVVDRERGVALINADIRAGRTLEQRRRLAVTLINLVAELGQLPQNHIYVTLTEHKGEDFHLSEGPLESWRAGEESLE